MLSLEPYADRREIPVFPHMLTAEAPIAGYTTTQAKSWISSTPINPSRTRRTSP